MKHLPKAKIENIVIRKLKNEILIYDLKSHRASSLNKVMSIIWNSCDGRSGFSKVRQTLQAELEMEAGEDFIFAALAELDKAGLLAKEFTVDEKTAISRRRLVFDYGLTAAAIPVVLSISVPTAAQAASCTTNTCTSDADCTDPASPVCISGCCGTAPVACQSDVDCTDPSFPFCIGGICSA